MRLTAALLLLFLGFQSFAQSEEAKFKVGDKAPSFILESFLGQEINSDEILKSGKSIVLVFYRGEWCPYCNKYLAELNESNKQIIMAGGEVIAISPETSEYMTKMATNVKPGFTLAYDEGYKVMDAYGVSFVVEEKMVEKVKNKKDNDMRESHGNVETVKLPVPATIVIGPDGLITYIHYDTDYSKRGEVDEIIEAL